MVGRRPEEGESVPVRYLPPVQERVADGEEPFQGERHGAVDGAHEPDLRHRDEHRQGGHPDGPVVGGAEQPHGEQVDGAGHVHLEIGRGDSATTVSLLQVYLVLMWATRRDVFSHFPEQV